MCIEGKTTVVCLTDLNVFYCKTKMHWINVTVAIAISLWNIIPLKKTVKDRQVTVHVHHKNTTLWNKRRNKTIPASSTSPKSSNCHAMLYKNNDKYQHRELQSVMYSKTVRACQHLTAKVSNAFKEDIVPKTIVTKKRPNKAVLQFIIASSNNAWNESLKPQVYVV